jgi:hypothetical protein
MTLRPPSGSPPPHEATIGGRVVALGPLADTICERYRDEYPDEQERYGAAGMAWCRHDNQWLLSWAVADARGFIDMREQASWLARVLHARDFPVPRLVRDLEIAAEVVEAGAFGEESAAVAARLRAAADAVSVLQLHERAD